MVIAIAPIHEYPETIPIVAKWRFDQWGPLIPGSTLETFDELLRQDSRHPRLPRTWIALSDDRVIGAASLAASDMHTRPDLSPWLVGVYVDRPDRRQGIGTVLVQHVVEQARKMGIRTLWLFTPDQEHFYQGLGWQTVERACYRGEDVVIMKIELDCPTAILLVRHGHVHNPQRVLYGRLPRFGLSERGREEARIVAGWLSARPLAAIYSSPLLRARQTAHAILAAHPGPALRNQGSLHTSALLLEVHTPFEGRALAELSAQEFNLYADGVLGYERPQDVLDRMLRFIARARRRHAGESIAAVTHGDPITFVIQWALGMPPAPRQLEALRRVGLSDGYPAPVCVVTLTFETRAADERPRLEYVEPSHE